MSNDGSMSVDNTDSVLSHVLSLYPDSPRSSGGYGSAGVRVGGEGRPGTALSQHSQHSHNHSLNVSHSDEFIQVRDTQNVNAVREGLKGSRDVEDVSGGIAGSSSSGDGGVGSVQGGSGECTADDSVLDCGLWRDAATTGLAPTGTIALTTSTATATATYTTAGGAETEEELVAGGIVRAQQKRAGRQRVEGLHK